MLTIGQLARAAGSTAKTIRYYEEIGVLPPAPRTQATDNTLVSMWIGCCSSAALVLWAFL